MKLRIATRNKLVELISNLRGEQLELSDELGQSEFLSLWKEAELSRLFSSWLTLAKYQGAVKIKEIREALKRRYESTQYTLHQICKSPKIIHVVVYDKKWRSNQDKFLTDRYERSECYIIPHVNLLLTPESSSIPEVEKLLSEVKPVRFRALLLQKVYNETKVITKISIKAVHEITGFHGMKQIVFEGDHVKVGLRGLHQRQDIRVQIDQIGPRIAVSTPDFDLKVGPVIRIKTKAGFEQISHFL